MVEMKRTLLFLFLLVSSLSYAQRVISSAGPWLDTNGKKIEAHGFQVFYHEQDKTYYWYGENKEFTVPGSTVWTWGIRAYASMDFIHWEDKGLIIPPDTVDVHSPLHYSQWNDRPHIIYNKTTKKWVCWIKNMSMTVFFVLEADNFLGPYKIVNRGFRPDGYGVGDFDLYVDDATGKAYIWFERPHWELLCFTLNDTYTDIAEKNPTVVTQSSHFFGLRPPYTREAPAHFMANGHHYLFTSGTTGYSPNESLVTRFDDPHGKYVNLGNPHPSDTTCTSFFSQITDVVKIHGKKNLYVVVADRWMPQLMGKMDTDKNLQQFVKQHKKRLPPEQNFEPIGEYPDYSKIARGAWDDIREATYTFLPMQFVNGMPIIEWHDTWSLDDYK
jgi:hypothetical protein